MVEFASGPTGHYDDVAMKGTLPKKKPLHHRWVAITTYALTDTPEEGGILDNENLIDLSVGCIDCEEPYRLGKDTRCRAPAYTGFDRQDQP